MKRIKLKHIVSIALAVTIVTSMYIVSVFIRTDESEPLARTPNEMLLESTTLSSHYRSYGQFMYNPNRLGLSFTYGMIYQSIDELVGIASVIIEGEVLERTGEIGEHVKHQVFRVKVNEVIKGSLSQDVIRVVQVGDIENVADVDYLSLYGVPLMKEGDRVILLLYPSFGDVFEGTWFCVGDNSGKFFFKDEDTLIHATTLSLENDEGELIAAHQLDEFSFSDFDRAMENIKQKASPEDVQRLQVLLDNARDAAKSAESRQTLNEIAAELRQEIATMEEVSSFAARDEALEKDLETVIELFDRRNITSISRSDLMEMLLG